MACRLTELRDTPTVSAIWGSTSQLAAEMQARATIDYSREKRGLR